jgi:hypothetical protein
VGLRSGLPPSRVELDARLVLDAAGRATTLWPDQAPLAVSFFELPAWEPPSGYRIPAWLRPPETMVPGIVPLELLLARTDTDAVLVTGLRAYPTGLEFTLTVRPRPDLPGPGRHEPGGPHRSVRFRDLQLALRFADGRTPSNDPRRWPRTFETEQPDPPFLYFHGAGGCEGRWGSGHWLWGLPRRGRWPSCAGGRPVGSRRPGWRSTPAGAGGRRPSRRRLAGGRLRPPAGLVQGRWLVHTGTGGLGERKRPSVTWIVVLLLILGAVAAVVVRIDALDRDKPAELSLAQRWKAMGGGG